jgi:biopolymer transport protein ExbD
MAGGDVAEPKERKRKGKKRRKGRRLGIRIDMTPLVDVAFLLLTFFMFTTSMSRPQTMEINLPPDKEVKVEVAETGLLTLRINAKGEVFWNYGITSPKRLPAEERLKFLREQQQTNPKLVALVKVDRTGKFSYLVNMIDELNVAGIQRFSIGQLLDQDKALIAKVQS